MCRLDQHCTLDSSQEGIECIKAKDGLRFYYTIIYNCEATSMLILPFRHIDPCACALVLWLTSMLSKFRFVLKSGMNFINLWCKSFSKFRKPLTGQELCCFLQKTGSSIAFIPDLPSSFLLKSFKNKGNFEQNV